MRKLLVSLLAVCTLGAGGLAVSGCGADDAVAGLDVEKASAATARKGTARIALTTRVEGAGLPLPLEVKGKGVTSLKGAEGNLTLDLAPLLSLAGAGAGAGAGSGDLELRFSGADFFVRPPKLDQLEIPGGKPWVALDLAQLAGALGLPTKGLGKLFTLEPTAQLRALKAAKGMKEVGEEKVAGVSTTHYRGTYKLADLTATLPAGEKAEVTAAIEKLEALGGGDAGLDEAVPTDVWVDEDGVTRRMVSTSTLPAQSGQPGGKVSTSYELSDFGVALDAAAPPAGEIYDATRVVTDALRQLARAGTTAG